MYGMGEHQITELAQLLAEGVPIQEITDIRGTCYLTSPENTPWGGVQCPDYAQVCRDKKAYAKAPASSTTSRTRSPERLCSSGTGTRCWYRTRQQSA